MENVANELKDKALNYVESLESPIGVYLRRSIFKEISKADAVLTGRFYERIAAEQSGDGSWGQMFVYTANNLWNLALLGYEAKDESVKRGLEWLLSIQKHQYRGFLGFFLSNNREDARVMRSTFYGEFGAGCTVFIKQPMQFTCSTSSVLMPTGKFKQR